MKTRKYISTNRRFDVFDKLRSYYIDGTPLSELQEKKRLQYEQAHQLRVAGYSKQQTIKILQKRKIVGATSEAYMVCNHAEILFGDVSMSNKKGLTVILTENFFRQYQKASKAGDLREANRALENIAKINGLMNDNDSINYEDLKLPIPVYTTNPKALKRNSGFNPN